MGVGLLEEICFEYYGLGVGLVDRCCEAEGFISGESFNEKSCEALSQPLKENERGPCGTIVQKTNPHPSASCWVP